MNQTIKTKVVETNAVERSESDTQKQRRLRKSRSEGRKAQTSKLISDLKMKVNYLENRYKPFLKKPVASEDGIFLKEIHRSELDKSRKETWVPLQKLFDFTEQDLDPDKVQRFIEFFNLTVDIQRGQLTSLEANNPIFDLSKGTGPNGQDEYVKRVDANGQTQRGKSTIQKYKEVLAFFAKNFLR